MTLEAAGCLMDSLRKSVKNELFVGSVCVCRGFVFEMCENCFEINYKL